MRPEEWDELVRLYEGARALPESEREAYLQRETQVEELRAEVRRLLAVRAPSTHFLEPPSLVTADPLRELGEFTLLEEIGRGGMGIVYRALQRPLARVVAVKVLPASFALTPRQVDRFDREARAVGRLSHPNVVQVYSVGAHDGVRYFAMEYVAGNNLAEELERLRADLEATADDRAHLPSSRASDYFASVAETIRQAADGLEHAHRSGLVHRDVKPSNLLLDPARRVKIVDFGLVRDEEQGAVSASQDLLGTPHYMSPEQARAQRHRVDHRTDVYSLGVVLYELLTLKRPFEGKTSQEVIASLLHRVPRAVRAVNSRVPRDLETICEKAMAREPDDRYATAGALRDDLARFLAHEAIEAKPPGVGARLRARAQRHRGALVTTGIVLLALALGFVLAREIRRRGEIGALTSAVSAALAEAPLREQPPGRQMELRRHLEAFTALRGALAADPGDVIAQLASQFAALELELLERGRADLAFARDAAQPEGAREDRRLSGLMTLVHAAQLFPRNAELQGLASAESALPTIEVRSFDHAGGEIPASVYLREIDVPTSGVGPRRALGTTPLPPTPVLPGYYRVVVVFDAGGFRELVANPGPSSMSVALEARRRLDEDAVTAGMIRIPAQTYTFPEFQGESFLQGRTVELDAFLVDATEVSNEEYHRFMQATGAAAPRHWQYETDRVRFLAEYGDRPVVGMTWSDAVACAAWMGKRLLTAAEWHRVAGGPDNWPTPYSPDPEASPRGNVHGPAPLLPTGRDYWQLYLAQAAPVASHEDARSPDGLYHLYGNVAELTESMAVVLGSPDAFVARPHDRLYFGQAWSAQALSASMRTISYWGIGPNYTSESIGFRCARSLEP